jgi:hypothetical protein
MGRGDEGTEGPFHTARFRFAVVSRAFVFRVSRSTSRLSWNVFWRDFMTRKRVCVWFSRCRHEVTSRVRSCSDLMDSKLSRRSVCSDEGRNRIGGIYLNFPPSCSSARTLFLNSTSAVVAISRSFRFTFNFRGTGILLVAAAFGTVRAGSKAARRRKDSGALGACRAK